MLAQMLCRSDIASFARLYKGSLPQGKQRRDSKPKWRKAAHARLQSAGAAHSLPCQYMSECLVQVKFVARHGIEGNKVVPQKWPVLQAEPRPDIRLMPASRCHQILQVNGVSRQVAPLSHTLGTGRVISSTLPLMMVIMSEKPLSAIISWAWSAMADISMPYTCAAPACQAPRQQPDWTRCH